MKHYKKTLLCVLSAMIMTLIIINPAPLNASDPVKTYTLREIEQTGPLILINKSNKLPTGYAPTGLERTNDKVNTVYSNTLLLPETLAAIEEMFIAAKKDSIDLVLYSGFRTEATQSLYYSRVGEGSISVAPPRASEHETGYAADIVTANIRVLDTGFGETKAGKWLAANCYKFGFILRYPNGKTHITKYMYEPWHYRYLGKEAAGDVHRSGLCYEEYIQEYGLPIASSRYFF
jgi:D-alanyl-D-alanine carboxypeptidase